jgi:hypothetical protein
MCVTYSVVQQQLPLVAAAVAALYVQHPNKNPTRQHYNTHTHHTLEAGTSFCAWRPASVQLTT